MEKWEYCIFGPLSTSMRPLPPESFCEIWYLTDSGIQVLNQFNLPFYNQDNVQYSAQLLWLLGEEGWELVGSRTGVVALSPGSGEIGHMLYFRRKKQESTQ